MDGDPLYLATESTHERVDAYWSTQGRTTTTGFIGQGPGLACDAWALLPVWTRSTGVLRTSGLSGPLEVDAGGTPSGGEGFELYVESPAWVDRETTDFMQEWWPTALLRTMVQYVGTAMRPTIEEHGLLTMAVTGFPDRAAASLEGWLDDDGRAVVGIGRLDTVREGLVIDVGWARETAYPVTPLLPVEAAYLRDTGDRAGLLAALRRGPTRHWAVAGRDPVVR
jgi:hypothetical protein